MPHVTVIFGDNGIVVDRVAVNVPFPAHNPNWHALQDCPDRDPLTFEWKIGLNDAVRGEEAAAILRPFLDARAAEMARQEAAAGAPSTGGRPKIILKNQPHERVRENCPHQPVGRRLDVAIVFPIDPIVQPDLPLANRFSKITSSTISPQKTHLQPKNCSWGP